MQIRVKNKLIALQRKLEGKEYPEGQIITELLGMVEALSGKVDSIKLTKGEDGKTPTPEQLIELIKPLIPAPVQGEPGKDIPKSELDDLRKDLLTKIADNKGGGNANRNIQVEGNNLGMFTDINLIGGGSPISKSVNQTLKRIDITFPAGGVGSGITRTVTVLSADTNAGAGTSIDYVYVCSGTMTLTLPTAVGNSNLYTVKNTGGTITVTTSNSETIDGNATAILSETYTAIDLVSDGVGWNIV